MACGGTRGPGRAATCVASAGRARLGPEPPGGPFSRRGPERHRSGAARRSDRLARACLRLRRAGVAGQVTATPDRARARSVGRLRARDNLDGAHPRERGPRGRTLGPVGSVGARGRAPAHGRVLVEGGGGMLRDPAGRRRCGGESHRLGPPPVPRPTSSSLASLAHRGGTQRPDGVAKRLGLVPLLGAVRSRVRGPRAAAGAVERRPGARPRNATGRGGAVSRFRLRPGGARRGIGPQCGALGVGRTNRTAPGASRMRGRRSPRTNRMACSATDGDEPVRLIRGASPLHGGRPHRHRLEGTNPAGGSRCGVGRPTGRRRPRVLRRFVGMRPRACGAVDAGLHAIRRDPECPRRDRGRTAALARQHPGSRQPHMGASRRSRARSVGWQYELAGSSPRIDRGHHFRRPAARALVRRGAGLRTQPRLGLSGTRSSASPGRGAGRPIHRHSARGCPPGRRTSRRCRVLGSRAIPR